MGSESCRAALSLPSRDTAAGSALAMVNVMDILDLNFSAQAPGEKGQGCEGGFAIVICTMPAWGL